jgi:hypothetical protein
METKLPRNEWNAAGPAAGRTLLAGSILFLITRPDVGVEARDALLAVLGLVLVTLDGAPEGLARERTPWYEYAGAFRGMVG